MRAVKQMEHQPKSNAPVRGQLIKEHYRIEHKAGQGGMAWLYKATHTILQEDMAIKLLFPEFCEDPRTRQRFISEAKIQFKLRHPHIVRVTEIIQEKKQLGIVQEWVNGVDLKVYLRGCHQLLPTSQIWGLAEPLLDALHFAHEAGVVHRDLKPSNILLAHDPATNTMSPKLTDFGVAKLQHQREEIPSEGMMIGTIKYIAPEQIKESQSVDRRADIYSMGVMLYQLFTGRYPFSGKVEKVLYHHLFETPVVPSSINAKLSPEIDAILLRCLEKDPKARFATAKELSDALRAVLPRAQRLPAPKRHPQHIRSNPSNHTPLPITKPSIYSLTNPNNHTPLPMAKPPHTHPTTQLHQHQPSNNDSGEFELPPIGEAELLMEPFFNRAARKARSDNKQIEPLSDEELMVIPRRRNHILFAIIALLLAIGGWYVYSANTATTGQTTINEKQPKK